jgi:hypothetical protein
MAQACKPKSKFAGDSLVTDAVSSIVGEIYTPDEFTLAMYRTTEQLDYDYLSEDDIGG